MRRLLRSQVIQLLLALFIGLGLGLAYSWLISPVKYVDADPAILRADFKDQYRVVIAASYTSTHNLERARARLQLLGDMDVVGALSAQAQRMVASGEALERVQSLAQLATDLRNGVAGIPATRVPSTRIAYASTPFLTATDIPNTVTPPTETPTQESIATETQTTLEPVRPSPTTSFAQTALVPVTVITFVPRPTFTPIPLPGTPFILVGQDTDCNPAHPGLLQFVVMDARRKPVAGIEIILTSPRGEDHSFTGFKPELGNGYADFVMQADTVYSIRVVAGGAFVPNISAPNCKDANGKKYPGGLLLTFQQP